MAKAMKIEESLIELADWSDVDNALREIGYIELKLQEMEKELNLNIMAAKELFTQDALPLQERREVLEKAIAKFAEKKRGDLGDKKSRELNFGRLGFRQSTRIILRNVKALLQALKAKGMHDCIIVKEDVSRDELKKYDDATLAALGVKKKVEDLFWYEVNREKLQEV
ncbi:MAG: host-nuclease inhibitor Gam family protein [Bacillota bacterium]